MGENIIAAVLGIAIAGLALFTLMQLGYVKY